MDAATVDDVLDLAKQQWDRGERPDAARVLATCPRIQDHKSVVLELAYEEYYRRSMAGERMDAEQFCGRFPICRLSLRHRIEVHEFLHDNIDEWIDGQSWPEAGDSFGEFSLLRELGRGADSRVFLAAQRSLSNRLTVLKLTQHGYREARLLSTLEHPNIVPIHSVEEDETTGLVAICMPYLTPWTLTDFLDAAYSAGGPPKRFADVIDTLKSDTSVEAPTVEDAPMSGLLARCSFVDGVLHIMWQLAQALRHTHERGILHLDLKPSNVLITRAGVPLVLDFGLSAKTDLKTAFGGTLPYMSPEQLRLCFPDGQRSETVSERSDIYSAGVLTYQVLTGKLPFELADAEQSAPQAARTLLQEQSHGVPELQSSCRWLDRRTSRFVERCLSDDVDTRPSSDECAELFRRSLTHGPRIRRWMRGNRWLVRLFLFLTIIAAGGIAAAIASREPAEVRHHARGLACLAQGDNESAIAHLTRAIELDPENDRFWYSRGRARQAMGDISGAIDDYEEALSQSPRPEYYASIGQCYAIQKEHSLAIQFLEEAIKHGLQTSNVYNCLGHCMYLERQNDAAIRAFEDALARDDDSWEAYYGLATALMRTAQKNGATVPAEAKTLIGRAVELGPENWKISYVAATIHYECARADGGDADYTGTYRYLQTCIDRGIPKPILESFAILPEMKRDERIALLVDTYEPLDSQTTPLNLFPEPVSNSEWGND